MTMNRLSVAILGILVLLCGYYCDLGLSYRDEGFIRMNLGGVRDRDCLHCLQNSAEINGLARFAVQEHNKKQNALLEFVRVLEAEEQVVAGKLYHLTLLVMDDGNKEFYEAKVLVTPWMHFKQLQEFKHAEGVHPWQPMPTNDPLVQDAANHAIQTIQQRSNSLIPYELLEILKSKAKVIEGNAKFDLRLRVKWGIKEENLRVKLIRTVEGKFFYFKIVQ